MAQSDAPANPLAPSSRPDGPATQLTKTYRRPASNSWRFIRAYYTTFQVIFSYLWLSAKSRAFGKAYREARIAKIHKLNARRVEATILELQGLFIKVGQLLSIMANFLPEEFRSELEGLQDQVPPRTFEDIRERIESELGKKVDDLFRDFSREPLASASLGQVHEAKLKSAPASRSKCSTATSTRSSASI